MGSACCSPPPGLPASSRRIDVQQRQSHYLDRILNPRSIAVVGAARDSTKRGNRAIRSLLSDRYQGSILPINPREPEILGFKCYPSISAVPEEIDLAIVCTAAHMVKGVIEECGRSKVKGVILLAAGFSEASEAGASSGRRSSPWRADTACA